MFNNVVPYGNFLGANFYVPIWMFVLSQVMGLICLVLVYFSLQIKNQRKMLLVNGIGSLFWLLMFIFVGAQLPMILIGIMATIRPLVFWWIMAKESPKRTKIGKIFLYFCLVVGMIGAVVSLINLDRPETLWIQILALATGIIFIVGQYLPSKHYVRIFSVTYALALILANTPLDTFNPMGIAIEAAKILSVIIFYVVVVKKAVLKKQLLIETQNLDHEIKKCHLLTHPSLSDLQTKERIARLMTKVVKLELAVIDSENMQSYTGCAKETKYLLRKLQLLSELREKLSDILPPTTQTTT